jgi:nucleoside-diphosphate-sugar epimerase
MGFCPRFTGGPEISLVHVQDVAAAAIHLLTTGGEGLAYNVATEASIPLGKFMTEVSRHSGIPVLPFPKVSLPSGRFMDILAPLLFRPEVFWSADTVGDTAWRRLKMRANLRGRLTPLMDQATLTYTTRGLLFDNRRLLETGFKLTFPRVEDTIRDAVRWYREERWLP